MWKQTARKTVQRHRRPTRLWWAGGLLLMALTLAGLLVSAGWALVGRHRGQ